MSSPASSSAAARRILWLAWGVLIGTVVVIISGDIVQATSSGAGCGETWPRCEGALIPGLDRGDTAVEFTHRMLTGILSLGFLALVVGSWRVHGRRHRVTVAALWATLFLVVEIVIGAMLVRFGWVEDDASRGRVLADAAHVVNTFLMVGALTLTAFFAGGGAPLRRQAAEWNRLVAGAGLIVLVAITGAINSLADTLAVTESVDLETTPVADVLVAVRGVHPFVAIASGIAVLLIVRSTDAGGAAARRVGLAVQVIIVAQFAIGLANIALLTPMETQVAHLLLADALWIAYLWFAALVLGAGSSGATSELAQVADAEAGP